MLSMKIRRTLGMSTKGILGTSIRMSRLRLSLIKLTPSGMASFPALCLSHLCLIEGRQFISEKGPMRQMRHITATKFVNTATIGVSLNVRFLSKRDISVTHNETQQRQNGAPCLNLRQLDTVPHPT